MPPPSENGLAKLVDTLAGMKAEGQKPTAAAYMALIQAAAEYTSRRGAQQRRSENTSEETLGLSIALAAIRDAKAGGIDLGVGALDELFSFSFVHPELLPSLLVELQKSKAASPRAFNALGMHAVSEQSLEQLVVVLVEMLQHNMVPSTGLMSRFVQLACQWGYPRLALQVVQRVESMHGGSKASTQSWVQILTASADCQFLEGVEAGWAHVIANKAYTPDEGLILAVLAVAGRWGRTDLATSALGMLPAIKVKPQEHHFAPLLEAFCNEGRVPEALKLLAQMRAAGIAPVVRTTQPIIKILNSADVIDQAFYYLEDTAKAGEPVDVAALNALIAASVATGDLQRARATQLAASDLGVTPDLETYNLVLRGCVAAAHRALGDSVLSELQGAGFHANAETYIALIKLCLTQNPYEDAFYYLEKMKADGFKPPASLYIDLAFKCAKNNDKRWRLVVEEAQTLGYKMPASFDRLREAKERGEKRAFRPRAERTETGERVPRQGDRRPRKDRDAGAGADAEAKAQE